MGGKACGESTCGVRISGRILSLDWTDFPNRCGEWCGDNKKRVTAYHCNPLKSLVDSTGLEPVAPAL